MEFRINEYQTPAPITFNFEELKAELSERVTYYKTVEYTEDQVAEGKKDKASLNHLKTAIEDRRKEIKKECLKPYEEFEAQVKQIVAIIDEPIKLIDKQLKDFEEKKKEEKREAIKELFKTMGAPSFVTLEKIWNEKWLNVSFRESAIKKEIEDRLAQVASELTIIDALPAKDICRQIYEESLSLSAANAEAERIARIQKAVDEKKAVSVEPIIEEPKAEAPAPDIISPAKEEKRIVVRFEAEMNVEQAKALAEFCNNIGIILRKI